MPRYLGKGSAFYLISCEYMPLWNASKEEKDRIAQDVCSNCGIFKDATNRIMKWLEAYLASKGKGVQEVELENIDPKDFNDWCKREGKKLHHLVCVHPKNKVAMNKWTVQVTEWAVVPSV